MSGPIVRKYGFPNFDAIFGKRDVPHGTADLTAGETQPESPRTPAADPGSPPGAGATKEEKESEDSAQL